MGVIDEFLANNEAYAGQFDKGSLPMPPAKKIAAVVLSCASNINDRLSDCV